MTGEDFIRKAIVVHNNFFDYSKVEFINVNKKVCIICPKHGEFWQRAAHHLNGCGCKKCYNERRRKIHSKTNEVFIAQCKAIFGDKYTYNKTEYINNKTDVCVTCRKHGDFFITPSHLLNGYGCKKCSKRYHYSTKEWIEMANRVHQNKYDYSKSVYTSKEKNICIICPIHGELWQIAKHHLRGCGCPKCYNKNWHLEEEISQFLDEKQISYERQKKFEWLKNKNSLSLDFYLNDYNVGIECQGIQHFKCVDFFGGINGFKNTLNRDKIKKALCKENGVRLLYYSNYTDASENIIIDKNKLLEEIQKYGTVGN